MLEAGRELDCAVAEKVMGYTKRLIPAWSLPNTDIPGCRFPRQDGWLFTNAGGYDDYFEGHVNDMFCSRSRGFRETLHSVPPYSADIAAAWEVVEKLKPGFGVSIQRCPQGYFAAFVVTDGLVIRTQITLGHEVPEPCAIGETAPHAICLAALKASGVPLG